MISFIRVIYLTDDGGGYGVEAELGTPLVVEEDLLFRPYRAAAVKRAELAVAIWRDGGVWVDHDGRVEPWARQLHVLLRAGAVVHQGHKVLWPSQIWHGVRLDNNV